jgi:hypothetical protein
MRVLFSSMGSSLVLVNDILLVIMAFCLGFYTAKSTAVKDTVVKYRFIPRTTDETLAMPDDTLREWSKMFNKMPSPVTHAGS